LGYLPALLYFVLIFRKESFVLVELEWIYEENHFSKVLELIEEQDEDFHFDGELITQEILEEFKRDGYLVTRDVDDGTFHFVHANMVQSIKRL
jgi:hypothetical protein